MYQTSTLMAHRAEQAALFYAWRQTQLGNGRASVTPVNDLQTHSIGEWCRCEPLQKIVGCVRIIVHNSFDGREFFAPEFEATVFTK